MNRSENIAPILKLLRKIVTDHTAKNERPPQQAAAEAENVRKQFISEIGSAHAEWQLASANYQQAVQPEVVDYYIYMMKAAQIKYQYLLRVAKANGIINDSTQILAEHKLPIDYEMFEETAAANGGGKT